MTLNQNEAAEAHYEALYRFALSLSKSESDAGDLVQQTFLQWMKNRSKILDQGKLKSWLFTTLYREFLRSLKRKERMNYVEDTALERDLPPVLEDAGRTLDGQNAMIALQQVPDPFRAALTLFYVQDFSYAEIAEVLAISPGTVMSRIYRGKQILKETFKKWENGQLNESESTSLHIMGEAVGS